MGTIDYYVEPDLKGTYIPAIEANQPFDCKNMQVCIARRCKSVYTLSFYIDTSFNVYSIDILPFLKIFTRFF